MKTCAAFVHEFDAYDDYCEAVYKSDREMAIAEYELAKAYHSADMNAFFEGEDNSENKAKAESGFLEKLGKSIESIITAIGNFIQQFVEKVTGVGKEMKTDKEKIEAILSKHPELAKDITVGLDKGWYTEKDVAGFEKDVRGLLKLVEQGKMDHKTFTQKLGDVVKNFADATAAPAAACKNVKDIFDAFPKVMKSVTDSKDAVAKEQSEWKKFQDEVKNQRSQGKGIFEARRLAHKAITDAKIDSAREAATAQRNLNNAMSAVLRAVGGARGNA